MPLTPNRMKPWTLAVTILLVLSALSCVSSFMNSPAPPATPMVFRIENATATAVEVAIEVINPNTGADSSGQTVGVDIPVVTVTADSVTYSTLTPIGAAAARADESTVADETIADLLPSQAAVRVPGFAMSEGVLTCGMMIKITATLDGAASPVLLAGAGTGTPGFDEGSVGETGERYLVEGMHFSCGENVVIRIGDDTSATSSASATTRGRLAVVEAGEASPFDPIEAPGSGPDDGDGGDDATSIKVQIDNRATAIVDVSMTVGTAEGEQVFDVSVPPNALTGGEFACGTELTLAAVFPNTDRPSGEEASAEFPDANIVLTGDGTGSPGFDESSVSPTGRRLLIVGSHVSCGDTVTVTIIDDSAVITPNGFNAIGVGAGTVRVLSGDDDPGQVDDPDPQDAEPDMTVLVRNVTDSFMRVNVIGGAASLGQALDIYVPANGQSVGAVSCADRYTVTAFSQTTDALQGLLDNVLIVLDGVGTGTSGFDAGSIGAAGQRLVLEGIHYECGDRIVVTITDPGMPEFTEPDMIGTNGEVTGFNDLNGNGVQDNIPTRLGEGSISVNGS